MTVAEMEQLVRTTMQQSSLFKSDDAITVVQTAHWHIRVQGLRFKLDMQLEPPGSAYLLWVWLEAELRGKGYGSQLYRLAEELAAAAGCPTLQQTASGKTSGGEARGNWLRRRGYHHLSGPPELQVMIKDVRS